MSKWAYGSLTKGNVGNSSKECNGLEKSIILKIFPWFSVCLSNSSSSRHQRFSNICYILDGFPHQAASSLLAYSTLPFSIRCFEFVLQFRTIDFVFLVSSSIIVKMGCSAARAIMVQWWTFHYNVASIRGVNSILFYLLLLSTDLQFVVTIYLQLTKSHSYLCRFLFMFWTLNVWKNSVICWVFTLVYLQSVWLRLLTITYCLYLKLSYSETNPSIISWYLRKIA